MEQKAIKLNVYLNLNTATKKNIFNSETLSVEFFCKMKTLKSRCFREFFFYFLTIKLKKDRFHQNWKEDPRIREKLKDWIDSFAVNYLINYFVLNKPHC